MKSLPIFASLVLTALGACVSQPSPHLPATLTDMSEANVAALTSALAEAMGRANIELGPTDGAPATQITVLPPPRGKYELNSPALPTQFDIVTDGTACWLVRQDTEEHFEAPGLLCTPLKNDS